MFLFTLHILTEAILYTAIPYERTERRPASNSVFDSFRDFKQETGEFILWFSLRYVLEIKRFLRGITERLHSLDL